jgi:hypothetical protein
MTSVRKPTPACWMRANNRLRSANESFFESLKPCLESSSSRRRGQYAIEYTIGPTANNLSSLAANAFDGCRVVSCRVVSRMRTQNRTAASLVDTGAVRHCVVDLLTRHLDNRLVVCRPVYTRRSRRIRNVIVILIRYSQINCSRRGSAREQEMCIVGHFETVVVELDLVRWSRCRPLRCLQRCCRR